MRGTQRAALQRLLSLTDAARIHTISRNPDNESILAKLAGIEFVATSVEQAHAEFDHHLAQKQLDGSQLDIVDPNFDRSVVLWEVGAQRAPAFVGAHAEDCGSLRVFRHQPVAKTEALQTKSP